MEQDRSDGEEDGLGRSGEVGGLDVAEEELRALRYLEDSCARLTEEGKHFQALENMERSLVLRQHLFGESSPEVWEAAKRAGEMCNLLAMAMLQQDENDVAFDLLRKAEVLTAREPAARAATLNNWGCFYRKTGKLHTALLYLDKALRIETQLEVVQNPGDVNLNLCAVHSQLGRHTRALEHAEAALRLVQGEVTSLLAEDAAGAGDRVVVLVIAYYNVGVEQEFLRRMERAFRSFRAGFDLAMEHLGRDHHLSRTLQQCCRTAKDVLAAQKRKLAKQRRTIGEEAPPTITGSPNTDWRIKPRLLLDPYAEPKQPVRRGRPRANSRLMQPTASNKAAREEAARIREQHEQEHGKEESLRRRSSARRRSALAGPAPVVFFQHALEKGGLDVHGRCTPFELWQVFKALPLGLSPALQHAVEQEAELVDSEPVEVEEVVPALPDIVRKVVTSGGPPAPSDWCTLQFHNTALYYDKRAGITQHQSPLAGPFKGVPAFADPLAQFIGSLAFRQQQEYDDLCANAAMEAEAQHLPAPSRVAHGHILTADVRKLLVRVPFQLRSQQLDQIEFYVQQLGPHIPALDLVLALPPLLKQAFEHQDPSPDDWCLVQQADGTSFTCNRKTLETRDPMDVPEDIGEADVLEYVLRHMASKHLEPDAPFDYPRFWQEMLEMPFGLTPELVAVMQEEAEFDSAASLTWNEAAELVPDALAALYANHGTLQGEWCRLHTAKGRSYAYNKRTGELLTHFDTEEIFKGIFRATTLEDVVELPWKEFWQALAEGEYCLTSQETEKLKAALPVPQGEPVTLRVAYPALQYKLRDLFAVAIKDPTRVSKKKNKKGKKSRPGSREGSRPGSREGSRPGSREGSRPGSRSNSVVS